MGAGDVKAGTRSIDDVVDTLRAARRRGKGATLLVGAGCSVAAGIPLASGFVEEIKARHLRDYDRAPEKTYAHCMAELSAVEARDLLGEFIDKAKVNWAHIGIAQLVKNGYVDRILTTNFDPLIARACAMAGVYPAIYDLAASPAFQPHWVPEQAIFHLHGQRSGFVLLNTQEQVQKHKDAIRPVFDEVGGGRPWVIVGYSGDNDPVFECLVESKTRDHRVYWVGYQQNPPAAPVRERLLAQRHAYHVPGYDADMFFVEVCRKLDIFPPEFLATPFTYLKEILDQVADLDLANQRMDVVDGARAVLEKAIAAYEHPPAQASGDAEATHAAPSTRLDLRSLLVAGRYEEIARIHAEQPDLPEDDLSLVGDAYGLLAHQTLESLPKDPTLALATLDNMDKRLQKAEAGRAISPFLYNTWALLHVRRARLLNGPERLAAYEDALARIGRSERLEPEDHYTVWGRGSILYSLASEEGAGDPRPLLWEASEAFVRAERLLPGDASTLNLHRLVLARLAELSGPEEQAEVQALLREVEAHAAEHRIELGGGAKPPP